MPRPFNPDLSTPWKLNMPATIAGKVEVSPSRSHSPKTDLRLTKQTRRLAARNGGWLVNPGGTNFPMFPLLSNSKVIVMSKLGPTGKFPRGKLTKGDRGEVTIALGSKNGKVTINFGTELTWIGMPPDQAIAFAQAIIVKAQFVKAGSSIMLDTTGFDPNGKTPLELRTTPPGHRPLAHNDLPRVRRSQRPH